MATLNNAQNPSGRLTTANTMRGSTVFNIALEELGRIEDVIIEEPAGAHRFRDPAAGRLSRDWRSSLSAAVGKSTI